MRSTRERIIEAALTFIAEQGLSEVTMIEVARTAGVARQTTFDDRRAAAIKRIENKRELKITLWFTRW